MCVCVCVCVCVFDDMQGTWMINSFVRLPVVLEIAFLNRNEPYARDIVLGTRMSDFS